MVLSFEQLTDLFRTRAYSQYGGEAVTQQQHALQCAHLAEQSGAAPALVAAALLHDLGHWLPTASMDATDVDGLHQYLAPPFLRGSFGDAVLEPIRMHVDAKRYLCLVDQAYWATLSPASQRSLELQGGRFSESEAAAFIAQPYAHDAVALRRWDDLAKNPAAAPPSWLHYIPTLEMARPGTTLA
jgi:phosphonate degradation associated HDIG domain protein